MTSSRRPSAWWRPIWVSLIPPRRERNFENDARRHQGSSQVFLMQEQHVRSPHPGRPQGAPPPQPPPPPPTPPLRDPSRLPSDLNSGNADTVAQVTLQA